MNKLTPEIIESATDEQLAELVAVHCMGWQKSNTKPYDEGCTAFQFWMNGDETLFLEHHWQPHLSTEKGKAQAIDLAQKYEMYISFPVDASDTCLVRVAPTIEVEDYNRQIAVLKACLMSHMEESK